MGVIRRILLSHGAKVMMLFGFMEACMLIFEHLLRYVIMTSICNVLGLTHFPEIGSD